MRYFAADQPNTVMMVDDDGQLLWAINPNCPEWAVYAAWQVQPGNELLPQRPSGFHELVNGAWLVDAVAARKSLQSRNRAACRVHILEHYPAEIQLSMNAGMYSDTEFSTYQNFLEACISEENRVCDLLDVAEDPTNIEQPVWPEV